MKFHERKDAVKKNNQCSICLRKIEENHKCPAQLKCRKVLKTGALCGSENHNTLLHDFETDGEVMDDKKGQPKEYQPSEQPNQDGYFTLDQETINKIANQSAQYQIPMLAPAHMIPAIYQAMGGGHQSSPLALPQPNPQQPTQPGTQNAPTVSSGMLVVEEIRKVSQ